MMEELEQRLTELEIRYAHQTQLVEELNEVVADCNLRIERLAKENRQLREMMRSLGPELSESPDE